MDTKKGSQAERPGFLKMLDCAQLSRVDDAAEEYPKDHPKPG